MSRVHRPRLGPGKVTGRAPRQLSARLLFGKNGPRRGRGEAKLDSTNQPQPTPLILQLRRPVEADHPQLVGVVDDWWGGRRLHELLPRVWLQHFTGTSWIAETADGRLAGFLVGFISPDRPNEAYIHMIASNPDLRQRAVARTLYEAFFRDVAARGVHAVKAITWAGNRGSIAFHTAMGFRMVDGPGARSILGVTAFPDYDYPGEDRVVFSRDLHPTG